MSDRQRVSNFFALVQEGRHKVAKVIMTDSDLQKALTDLFEEQAKDFLSPDTERIEFAALYTIDDDRVFEIKPYTLPEEIQKAAKSPDGIEPFTLKESEPANLKSVFATAYDPKSGRVTVLFQKSSRTRILESGNRIVNMFVRGGTFQKLKEPGLTLDSELVAIFDAGSLLFRKFPAINPILDIKEFFVEATAEEVKEVLGHPLFVSEDTEVLASLCDMSMRKRVAFIKATKILDKATARKTCMSLRKFFEDIEISYTTKGEAERLKLPGKKKDLKRLLNYLCESYYLGDITEEKYESNSHKKLN